MAKDPAVLFYTADFLADTTLWSYEELGRYIKLLCMQHLNGGISDTDFNAVAEGCKRIVEKFHLSEDGLYRNKRMQEETEKRKNYSISRGNNRRNGLKKHMNNICKSYDVHMENENINENINVIINYLNKVLSTKYKSSSEYIKKNIRARLGEGFTPEDFYTVIDKKFKEWTGTKMEKFLRPETLFGTKFQEYLNQIGGRDDEYTAPSQAPPIKRLNPRHGDFDPNEAFNRALDRSYGKQEKENLKCQDLDL